MRVDFQQVEDNLAALRILEQEPVKVQETIQAANRALTVSTAQYSSRNDTPTVSVRETVDRVPASWPDV